MFMEVEIILPYKKLPKFFFGSFVVSSIFLWIRKTRLSHDRKDISYIFDP